ncbi:MAG TPA: SDR family NAD(P)-dependent oxidoreductase, partial [Nitrososphaeraceae archaeon]|nr:SDR family NAD(P)-dependent oxidoreductase [Nitrososphaeraceae archaeon]
EEHALQSSSKFSNKVALITGSGTGIGQSIAKRFAENGTNIIIMGRRKEPLEQTTTTLNKIIADNGSSARIRSFPGIDVSDEIGINGMVKQIAEEFGKIDIVVNNAGVSGPVRAFTNADFTEFRDCVAIHLTGTFWTARQCLQLMERGAKIITISTFFSEENRYEQRPYRFRTPYTAAQGAKNRLAEALAWELADDGIRSIATNPGPVHSDRIYKTVYPKAAAEFLRIGGYAELSSSQIDYACSKLLPLLGEDNATISATLREVAQEISQLGPDNSIDIDLLANTLSGLISKLQEIAEKIQNNTRNMIIDREFLSQEEVADVVLNLCDEKISKLVNGRIVPSDRVFYPVRPHIRTSLDNMSVPLQVSGNVVIIIANPSSRQELDRLNTIARVLHQEGIKDLILFLQERQVSEEFQDFSCIEFDLSDEEQMRIQIQEVRKKFGVIDTVVYLTGNYDYNRSILSLSRKEWESLVDKFINVPALVTKESVNAMCPDAVLEPIKYKNSNGKIILIGPESPVGTKISGLIRARAEIFRGALRPYAATVNQELFEVLGSSIRLFLILPGNLEGSGSDAQRLSQSVVQIISDQVGNNNDSIFYVDEVRK